MARIYRRTDRISIKIDDILIKIAPLSSFEKAEVQSAMIAGRVNNDIKEATRGVVLSLKYAVKGIEGVLDSDGNPYVLKFENNILTDECVDDLLNLEITGKLTQICAALTNNIPDQFTNQKGERLNGVEIIKAGPPEKNS